MRINFLNNQMFNNQNLTEMNKKEVNRNKRHRVSLSKALLLCGCLLLLFSSKAFSQKVYYLYGWQNYKINTGRSELSIMFITEVIKFYAFKPSDIADLKKALANYIEVNYPDELPKNSFRRGSDYLEFRSNLRDAEIRRGHEISCFRPPGGCGIRVDKLIIIKRQDFNFYQDYEE